ncbi:MAG: CDP-alcohol phosphatidyltransferase family protein [Candidatus Aminicenantes bacterium]|nr:CDP-alcohol phosphatidyltransferase family protein [Candidatus Aminicenantes bacterium]
MNRQNSQNFSFKTSLKDGPKYPILHYIRIERYFTRPLASMIVKLIYNTGITPNQITVLSFILGILGAISYSFGQYHFFIAGGILMQLSSIFDCADGMLARSKNICTRYGAYLDLFLDRIVDFFFFLGVAAGYYLYSGDIVFLILGLVNTGLYSLQIILFYIVKIYKGDFNAGESAEARGLGIFFFSLLSILNHLEIIIISMTIVSLSNISMRVIMYKRLGEKNLPLPGSESTSDNRKQADTGKDQT